MRNHEYYFSAFQGGSKQIDHEGAFYGKISEEWGSFENWLDNFKLMATTRGVGWAMLYYDPKSQRLLNAWVDEQHLGQLSGCTIVLALDMWEHSFVYDYQPSGKKKYIEDFFVNLNWQIIEDNFKNSQ